MSKKFISPKDAELLAQATIESYINSCNCQTATDVANALMKLNSMTGLALCSVVGQEDAVAHHRAASIQADLFIAQADLDNEKANKLWDLAIAFGFGLLAGVMGMCMWGVL